jgi:hypothetical protein
MAAAAARRGGERRLLRLAGERPHLVDLWAEHCSDDMTCGSRNTRIYFLVSNQTAGSMQPALSLSLSLRAFPSTPLSTVFLLNLVTSCPSAQRSIYSFSARTNCEHPRRVHVGEARGRRPCELLGLVHYCSV